MEATTGPDTPPLRAVPPAGPASAVLRPVRAHDHAALWALLAPARDELVGMVSLPSSADDARRRCHRSARTVADLAAGALRPSPGGSRSVLLVLEDGDGELVGVTGFSAKWEVPNFAVRIVTSPEGRGLCLAGQKQPWTCTELNATFLGPRARGRGHGTLLSRGRFLLLTLVADQVPPTLVSHLRGPFSPGGSAPFWEVFGRQVAPQWPTSMAAERALAAHPDRIEDLVEHSIEVEPRLLEIVGSVNRLSLPAFHLLMAEGLRPNGLFDPIDAGPTLAGPLTSTRTWRLRTPVAVAAPGTAPDDGAGLDALVATTSLDDFRVVRGRVGLTTDGGTADGGAGTAPAIAEATTDVGAALGLEPGREATALVLETGQPEGGVR